MKLKKTLVLVITLFSSSVYSKIHVFAECHARMFTGFPKTEMHAYSTTTMFRCARENKNLINLRRLGIKRNDIVIMGFGEVDSRVHVKRIAARYNILVEEMMEDLASRYFKGIVNITSGYPLKAVIVNEILPPSTFRPSDFDNEIPESIDNKRPVIGTLEERIYYNKYLNSLLEQKCTDYGFYFLKYADLIRDEQGALNPLYDDKKYHLAEEYRFILRKELRYLLARVG